MNLNFSENFKQLRKEKGDTQEKIAEVFGVTAQTISRWELSICYPDLELLPSIANFLVLRWIPCFLMIIIQSKRIVSYFTKR